MAQSRFQDRVALITGAAHGIGKAAAQAFAQEGAVALILDKDAEATAAAVADIEAAGGRAGALIADATDGDQVREAVARAIAEWEHIDVLVNNIGWNRPTPFLESDEAHWMQLLDLNLLVALRLSHAVLPYMVARRYGRIVNISSIAGIHPWPGSVLYGVAKAGIVSMTRSLAVAMAPHNIRVNVICPGPTETELTKIIREQNPAYSRQVVGNVTLGRFADPGEIAAAILFLASDESSFIVGQTLPVDGGYNMM